MARVVFVRSLALSALASTLVLACGDDAPQGSGGSGTGGAPATTGVGGATQASTTSTSSPTTGTSTSSSTTGTSTSSSTTGQGGAGGGLLGDGDPCADPSVCLSGNCVDGVCCDTACDGPCAVCDLPSSPGTCSPAEAGTASEGSVCIPYVCDGQGLDCPVSCMTQLECVGTCSVQDTCVPPTGAHAWSKRFGDAASQIGDAVAVDGAGSAVIAGRFSGSIDFGAGALASAGSDDVYVAKFDSSGGLLWGLRFGGGGSDGATVVTVDDNGNVIVAGGFSGTVDFGGGPLTSSGMGDIFVLKLDPSGNHLWSKRIGGFYGEFVDAIDSYPGGVVLAGGFRHNVDFGGGLLMSTDGTSGSDIFVLKLDDDGNHVFSQRHGEVGLEPVAGVAADATGGFVLTGSLEAPVDFGGGALSVAGIWDVFLARFDANGAHVWSKRFGDAEYQYAGGVDLDADGNVLMIGDFYGMIDLGGGAMASSGQEDVYVGKLDPDGDHLWSMSFGDPVGQNGNAVKVDDGGNVVLGGSMAGTVDFGLGPLTSAGAGDAFAVKLDPNGVPLWSKRFGAASTQTVRRIAIGPSREIFLTAPLVGSIDFGGGALTSAGLADVYLARLLP